MSDIYTIKGLSRDLWIRDDPAIPANTKAFDIGGGRRRLIVHGGPINYWAPAGLGERTDRAEWDDIDPTLRLVDAAGKAYGGQYLADRNAFTIGFRADGRREKFCGFRPLGRTDIQYETTLHSIVLDGKEVPIPDEFAKVSLTSPTTIEHVIAEGISVWHQVGYRGVREAIKVDRPVKDFRIVYRVHLAGATPPEAKSAKDGVTEYRADSRGRLAIGGMGDNVHIPRPVMWSGEDGITEAASREIEHRLYEQGGVIYYEKTPTERGREWLASQDTPLYIDGTIIYSLTADGMVANSADTWSSAIGAATGNYGVFAEDATQTIHNSYLETAYFAFRAFFYFNTTGVWSSHNVTSCQLYIRAGVDDYGSTDYVIYSSTQGDPLSVDDFGALGSALTSPQTLSAGTYNMFSLPTSAVTKEGITRLALLGNYDASGDPPSGLNGIDIYFSDYMGVSRDPYLDIEVYVPATNVFYSVCPYGTGNLLSGGSPTIEVDSSGNATLSLNGATLVNNIGQGVAVEYNSEKYFISEITDLTHFKLVDALGVTAPQQASTSLTSVHHEYASIVAALGDSGVTPGVVDEGHLNGNDLVSLDIALNIACYYDHDDYTTDRAGRIWTDSAHFVTDNNGRHIRIYTPTGGTQSINNQRAMYAWDEQKFIFDTLFPGSSAVYLWNQSVRLEGLQILQRNVATYETVRIRGLDASHSVVIDSCHINGGGYSITSVALASVTGSVAIVNTIIGNTGATGIHSTGGSPLLTVSNSVVTGCDVGIHRETGTFNVLNSAVFNNTTDFSGDMNITYTASDDNPQGVGNVDISPGATETDDWAEAFTDYSNGDFSLKSGSDLIDAGIGPALDSNVPTTDIVGNPRSGNTCSIGAFEYVEEEGGLPFPPLFPRRQNTLLRR